jgi:5-formyltetrahydrofolate cyclo-ligase
MSNSISEQKSQLRQQCRATRKALGEETRLQASLAICERIERWPIFQQSETVLTYMPIKSEADLTPLLERCTQKKWMLPRIIPEEDHRMVFHLYDPSRLILHPFGMAEPAPDLPVIIPEEIQLALVPGLAFDRHGWRLGYGGGYFDRFLKGFKGVSAGVVFHALLLDEVPHTRMDIPMDWILTEREFLTAASIPVEK